MKYLRPHILSPSLALALVIFSATSGLAQHRAAVPTPGLQNASRARQSIPHRPSKQPADYVNPFIGASTSISKAGASHGLGKTFPGAATPYGMVQLSPNTITGGDNGPGYSYEHSSIEGFAFTQMSGIGWYGDLGNFLVLPTSGPLKTSAGRPDHEEEGYRSSYSKSSEHAQAGYYDVFLSRYRVRAEMTAAPHSGILRFTFPKDNQSRIQIDLARRVGGTSTEQYVKIVDAHTISGWMKCTPDGGGWGNGAGHASYTVYFYAQFSKPLKDYGVWSADIPDDWTRKLQDIESRRYQDRVAAAAISGVTRVHAFPATSPKDERHSPGYQGKHLGFFTEFSTRPGEQVLMKAGISFAGMASAEQNLRAEIADWDFDRVYRNAKKRWNQALGKMSIDGGTEEEKTIFYTALYHTMIDPRDLSDLGGTYPGGDGKIHHTTAYTRRTIFSGWDVFRSQMPLQTIINPRLVNDMIRSLVDLADETGKHYLERWELLNAYSGCMIGNPAVVVMADAYAKGIRGYDLQKAYGYAVNTCERFGNKDDKGWSYSTETDDHHGSPSGHSPYVISNTLENGFSEWCLSRLAAALGKKEDELKYARRSLSYKNIFDTTVRWFRPRLNDGTWEAWPTEGRLRQNYGTVESNLYQQGWFVPH
ncbi:MAG TPA: GH92 family glycosyl hydrolase, partial [Puia sp.]|nr:GH92 family glycosyl hydrolase [Puia sp.]